MQQDCVTGRGRARAHPCPLRIPSWKVERRSTAVGCKFGVWYGWRTGPRKSRSPSSRSRNSQHMSCRCGRGRAPRQLLRTSAHHRALCSDGCALQTRQRGLMPQRARKPRRTRAPEMIVVRRTVVPTRAGSQFWTSWRACWHLCGSWRLRRRRRNCNVPRKAHLPPAQQSRSMAIVRVGLPPCFSAFAPTNLSWISRHERDCNHVTDRWRCEL